MNIWSVILPYFQTFRNALLPKGITHFCYLRAWYVLSALPKTVVLAIAH